MKKYLDAIVVVGLFISIALGFIGAIAIPGNNQFGFLVGFLGFVITLLIETIFKLNKYIDVSNDSSRQFIEIIRDQKSLIQSHDSEIFDHIAKDFIRQFQINLNNLAQGFINVGDGYLSISDLFHSGAGAIKEAKRQILAVEAGNDPRKWIGKNTFLSYHQLIVTVVKARKVDFERIWVINQDQTEYHEIWDKHRREGLKKIYYVYEHELPDNLKSQGYLDFAIIDDEILIKSSIRILSGQQKVYEGGQISVVKEHLAIAKKRFSSIKTYAREYRG
jgi:hypothetical protein